MFVNDFERVNVCAREFLFSSAAFSLPISLLILLIPTNGVKVLFLSVEHFCTLRETFFGLLVTLLLFNSSVRV